jgi:hypothetical protein
VGNLSLALKPARYAARALALFALPTLLSVAVLQAAEAGGTLAACRTLHDSGARLDCYDRLPDLAAPPPAATARASAPAAVAPASKAAAPAALPAAAPDLTAEQRFGISELQQARAEQAKVPPKEELRELRAKVAKVQRMGQGGLRVTLANDQVWYQIVPSEKLDVSVGEEIVIKSASFGSFLLVDQDRHSARVHRAE